MRCNGDDLSQFKECVDKNIPKFKNFDSFIQYCENSINDSLYN